MLILHVTCHYSNVITNADLQSQASVQNMEQNIVNMCNVAEKNSIRHLLVKFVAVNKGFTTSLVI